MTEKNNPHLIRIMRLRDEVEQEAIDLSSGYNRVDSYMMKQGGEDVESVNEAIMGAIGGQTHESRLATLRALKAMFPLARRYQKKLLGERVYIEFQAGGSGNPYRSEILDGECNETKDTLDIDWANDKELSYDLRITRRGFWEGSERVLPIGDDFSFGLAGLTIYNHCDIETTNVAAEVIDAGDGSTHYGGTFAHIPVKRGSVVISYVLGGVTYTATDDSAGNLSGTCLVGTINYVTGVWEVEITYINTASVAAEVLVALCNGADYQFSYATYALLAHTPIRNTEVIKWTVGAAAQQQALTTQNDTSGSQRDTWYGSTTPPGYGEFLVGLGLLDKQWAVGFWTNSGKGTGQPPDVDTPITIDYDYNYNGPDLAVNITANYTYKSGGHANYVDVPGKSVFGDLPAPIEYLLTDNYGVDAPGVVFMGTKCHFYPREFDHIIEGESDVTMGLGIKTANAGCSDGFYMAITWAGDAETEIWRTQISSGGYGGGGLFTFIARWQAAPGAGIKLRLKLGTTLASPTYYWVGNQSDEIDSTARLLKIDTARIPPFRSNEPAPIVVSLFAQKTGGGTINLDFMQMTPMEDSFAKYNNLDAAGWPSASLKDDGLLDFVAIRSGTDFPSMNRQGSAPLVWPNQNARIYFLVRNIDLTAPIARTSYFSAVYRPRRSSI